MTQAENGDVTAVRPEPPPLDMEALRRAADNPYAASYVPLHDHAAHARAMYSPRQVGLGTFLGGPAAATWFLWANYRALGRHAAATRTVWLGLLATVVVMLLALVLPESVPGFALSIPPVLVAHHLVQSRQLTKAAIESSPQWFFQSNWKVLGVSVLMFFCSLLPVAVIAIIAIMAGVEF